MQYKTKILKLANFTLIGIEEPLNFCKFDFELITMSVGSFFDSLIKTRNLWISAIIRVLFFSETKNKVKKVKLHCLCLREFLIIVLSMKFFSRLLDFELFSQS